MKHRARPQWAGSAALALASVGSFATEGGGNSYPMGVETNYNGIMLPRGSASVSLLRSLRGFALEGQQRQRQQPAGVLQAAF